MLPFGREEPSYLQLVTEKPVQRFLQKFFLSEADFQTLVVVSPYIGSLAGTRFSIERLNEKIARSRIPTYVITREPEDDYHREGVAELMKSTVTEIRFNHAIHAKLYVCMAKDVSDCFALFGSGNLTLASIEKNIELGVMVYGRGRGRDIINELYQWGIIRLRTLPGSRLIKRAQVARGG